MFREANSQLLKLSYCPTGYKERWLDEELSQRPMRMAFRSKYMGIDQSTQDDFSGIDLACQIRISPFPGIDVSPRYRRNDPACGSKGIERPSLRKYPA
jgi:hypothetical protein